MVAASIHFPMSKRFTKEEPGVGTTTHVWDPNDRLTGVQTPGGDRFTFTYNADGQRVQRYTPDEERKFVYDRLKPLLETTAAGQTTLTYDYSGRDAYGELTSRTAQGQTHYHVYDALGSTESLLDALESISNQYAYRAFGKVESKAGATASQQTFVGRYGYFAEEQLGLYFLSARYHDLATGQFISRIRLGLLDETQICIVMW